MGETQMTEQRMERRLAAAVKRVGGMALKFVSPGWAGAPDRLVLLPGGRVIFVELKRPGAKMRKLQEYRAQQLIALGFDVRTISTLEELGRLVGEVIGIGSVC